ncbi:MAG: maleylpyruvate isomerase N-terminal domain-containing protein [Microthrixaceae bacterium]|nr:maleylpyruvate isomerase N-terminal domain-containing protein [Microthrixaceae bacterium]
MDFEFEQLRAAFGEQSTTFVDLVHNTRDLSTPTALEGWDCAVLIGHVSTAVEALTRWQADPPPDAPEIDAVAWWDGVDPGMNDTFSHRYAAKRSHEQLRELIGSAVQQAKEMLPTMKPGATLVAPGGIAWTRFDQGLATRVVELTVHGLDLAAATGSTTAMSPRALAVTGQILDQRLNGTRPAELDDNGRWVAAATGREPHSDSRLPVIQ